MVNAVATESATGHKSGEGTALTFFPYLRLQLRGPRGPSEAEPDDPGDVIFSPG